MGPKRAAGRRVQPKPKKKCMEKLTDVRSKIKDLLQANSKGGAVATSKVAPEIPSMPDLHVNGFGRIPLPVDDNTAKKLKPYFENAPYGLGEATIVDENVRQTFQLPPEKFKLKNKNFLKVINEKVIGEVKAVLGCQESVVRAEIYKLLLYEKGGHFKPHRDTEKANGMFATLIVQLPSSFTGGDLVITHRCDEHRIKFNHAKAAYVCMYAAHYSDVQHEIKEIKSGYRLAVVFSLCWSGNGIAPQAPFELIGQISQLQNLLMQLSQTSPPGTMTAWALQHMYSLESLQTQGIAALKGEDTDVGEILSKAVDAVQEDEKYTLLLVQYTKHVYERGHCKIQNIYSKHSGRNCFTLHKTYTVYKLGNYVTTDGKLLEIENFGDDDAVGKDVLNAKGDDEGDENDEWWAKCEKGGCSGPSGNEGASREFWYHRCLLIFWKEDEYLDVLANNYPQSALSYLEKRLLGPDPYRHVQSYFEPEKPAKLFAYKCPTDKETVEKEVIHLFDIFTTNTHGELETNSENNLVKLLTKLESLQLVKKFVSVLCLTIILGTTFFCSFSSYSIDYLYEVVKKYSWHAIEEDILKLFDCRPLHELLSFLGKCPDEVPAMELVNKLGIRFLKDNPEKCSYRHDSTKDFESLIVLQFKYPEVCHENLIRLPNLEKWNNVDTLVHILATIRKSIGESSTEHNPYFRQLASKFVELVTTDPEKVRIKPIPLGDFFSVFDCAAYVDLTNELSDFLRGRLDILDYLIIKYHYEEVKMSDPLQILLDWRNKTKVKPKKPDKK